MSDAVLTGIAIIISAAISAFVAWFLGRDKALAEPVAMRATAAEAITKAAGQLVSDMRAEIDDLRTRLEFLEKQILIQEAEIDRLRCVLEAAEERIVELERENADLRLRLYGS